MTPNILQSLLDCCNIKFTYHITGDEVRSIHKIAEIGLHASATDQQTWFTHSKTNVEGGLLKSAKAILELHHKSMNVPDSIAHLFTDDVVGIMTKTSTMDAVMN